MQVSSKLSMRQDSPVNKGADMVVGESNAISENNKGKNEIGHFDASYLGCKICLVQ